MSSSILASVTSNSHLDISPGDMTDMLLIYGVVPLHTLTM